MHVYRQNNIIWMHQNSERLTCSSYLFDLSFKPSDQIGDVDNITDIWEVHIIETNI